MNLVKLEENLIPKSYYDFYGKQCPEIYINKKNLIPGHINQNVIGTEYYIKNNSDTLFLNIGESWTYGEGLPGIKSPIAQFNLQTALSTTFGPRISNILGSDLYQYAVPGNNNLYMYLELDRILEYVTANFNYKKIYIAINQTDNTREMSITGHPLLKSHKLYDLFFDNKFSIQEWVKSYDDVWANHLSNTLEKYNAYNLDLIVWRNFTRQNSDKKYNLKTCEFTWPEYSALLENIKIESPALSNFPRMHEYVNERKSTIIQDRDWFEQEMSKQEIVANFISKSIYHKNHPNEQGHLVWALYLIRQAGWANI